jgi:4-amino-4-deoxy-L-arabinose transferase-like glycosyltransferase
VSLSSRAVAVVPRRTPYLLLAVLAALWLAWLIATAADLGFARDEGFYFSAARSYARWFDLLGRDPSRAVERSAVDAAWSANHEHPSLVKSLFALSWLHLHERLGWIAQPSLAFRLPAMVLSSLTVFGAGVVAAEAFGAVAGVAAAGFLAATPGFFHHAHLACFDAPIAALWVFVAWAHLRALRLRTLGSLVLLGVAYGLALETKHNAWMLPAVLVPHGLVFGSRGRGGKPVFPWAIVAPYVIGPVVFVALWPWLWFDTLDRAREYAQFHLHHDYYNIEFLGRNVFAPPAPRAYLPVIVGATVPTTMVLAAFFGLGAPRRWLPTERFGPSTRADRDGALVAFCFLAVGASFGPFFLPNTPIFGGYKHWLQAYPFAAMLAGRGVAAGASAVASRAPARLRGAALVALVAGVLVGPFAVTQHAHPFGIAPYVPLVGGMRGGARLGLNRQFWGYTTQNVADVLATMPQGARVFVHDTAWDSWAALVAERRVRPDLQAVFAPQDADVALVQHELHMNEVDHNVWVAFDTQRPIAVLAHDGVPYVSVYRRKP